MTHRSKSTLFLIEQLIVIAVFAICAAACISILTTAFFYTNDSKATSRAIVKAETGAEVFKASGGDHDVIAYVLDGIVADGASGGTSVTVFYNNVWQVCTISNADYFLILLVDAQQDETHASDHDLVTGVLTVSKITGEELVSFPLATRGEAMQHG